MNQAKLILKFLLMGLLFVSTLSRADEAIALLESIRASSDYREFKSKSEIPAPILARVEKFAGAIYDSGGFLTNENRLKSRLRWAVTGQNYYMLYLFQGGGVVAYNTFLMYLTLPESQEIVKVAELTLESYQIKSYPEFLEALKIGPPHGLPSGIKDDINRFLMNRR